MDLRPFLGERAVLVRGRRRFVCRAPTVATVFRLVASFPGEVLGLYKSASDLSKRGVLVDGGLAAALVVVVPLLLKRREEFASVLETCVDVWGGAPGELAEALDDVPLVVDLVGACLALVDDLPALVETLHLDKFLASQAMGADAEVDVGPSAQVVALAVLARTFSCDPMTVAAWPYEAFVTMAQDVVPYITPKPPGGEVSASDDVLTDAATLSAWGAGDPPGRRH